MLKLNNILVESIDEKSIIVYPIRVTLLLHQVKKIQYCNIFSYSE